MGGCAPGIAAGLSGRVGRSVDLTDDQRRGDGRPSAPTSPGRPRCCASSRATSAPGKTAVAAYAFGLAASSGGQGALLAPTDLLARQLAATLGDLLADAGLPVTLLTGSLSGAGRRSALEALATGQAQVAVGTHALFGEGVDFARLDLVIIDEQHRFGVAHREALAAKGLAPHVLLMTATPIPRTLGQVLYADLDVSDLRSAPCRPGRHTDRHPQADRAGGHLGEGARRRPRRATARSSSCPTSTRRPRRRGGR